MYLLARTLPSHENDVSGESVLTKTIMTCLDKTQNTEIHWQSWQINNKIKIRIKYSKCLDSEGRKEN